MHNKYTNRMPRVKHSFFVDCRQMNAACIHAYMHTPAYTQTNIYMVQLNTTGGFPYC